MEQRDRILRFLARHRAWLVVGLTILLVAAVRVRVRAMPLERDEGEYAYAGQLILEGVPPYREAYNMKLPGTYAAYALIMALLGQTPSAIHVGVAFVNIASIVLMFLIGRRLVDETTGVVATVCFALLSLSPSVLGLAGHATHFVVLPALGGIYILLRTQEAIVAQTAKSAVSRVAKPAGAPRPVAAADVPNSADGHSASEQPRSLELQTAPTFHAPRLNVPRAPRSHAPTLPVFLAGLLFGIAFLMKQHGLFFGLFGGLYLLWLVAFENRDSDSKPRALRSKIENRKSKITPWLLPAYALGWALPYALTCLILWATGTFHQFVFWTITYAGKYASAVPLVNAPDILRATLAVVVSANLLFWLLPWAGALLMWWDERLGPSQRFFLTALLLCSIASVCVGYYFRTHYFILLLPALSLLSGVAVSRSLHVLRHDKTIELFLTVPVLGVFVLGLPTSLIGNGSAWFASSPAQASEDCYGSTLFTEAVKAGEYIKAHTAPGARVAVIGSEPEICFYSHRHSATGYLYMYPMMESQPLAAHMQADMISEIERARPDYAVYVGEASSWLRLPESKSAIFDWWRSYWPTNFQVVRTFSVDQTHGGETSESVRPAAAGTAPVFGGDTGISPASPDAPNPDGAASDHGFLLLFERKH